MIIAWIRPALALLRLQFGTDPGLRRWLRALFPNSREVQGEAAIPAGWLALYVAIGVLWHAVHTLLTLALLGRV